MAVQQTNYKWDVHGVKTLTAHSGMWEKMVPSLTNANTISIFFSIIITIIIIGIFLKQTNTCCLK